MKEPKLLPRSFKIDHDFNEYTFFVVWRAGLEKPWAIQCGTAGLFLTAKCDYNYHGHDTLYFATPEEALAWWKEVFEARGESSRTAKAG